VLDFVLNFKQKNYFSFLLSSNQISAAPDDANDYGGGGGLRLLRGSS
jgi:hypothetical protein